MNRKLTGVHACLFPSPRASSARPLRVFFGLIRAVSARDRAWRAACVPPRRGRQATIPDAMLPAHILRQRAAGPKSGGKGVKQDHAEYQATPPSPARG